MVLRSEAPNGPNGKRESDGGPSVDDGADAEVHLVRPNGDDERAAANAC